MYLSIYLVGLPNDSISTASIHTAPKMMGEHKVSWTEKKKDEETNWQGWSCEHEIQ